MNICICGGGNLGHVCAGFLASQPENKISLLTTRPDIWSRHIDIVAPEGKSIHGVLNCISNNPQDVIPDAQIVLLCLPGFAIREVLCTIAPYLAPDTWVGSVVSNTGFFFEAMKVLPPDQPLFGFQRVPFISRVTEYGKEAELKGYKESLSVAVEQSMEKEIIRSTLENLFRTPVKLLYSHYEASLSNSNPLLHTSRLYTMWKDWKPGIVYDHTPGFYSDWTVEASELYIAMDVEFQSLLKALGVKEGCVPSVLDYYESKDAESLARKIKSIPAFQGISSPMKQVDGGWIPDFTSRYFTEDFPYGLRFIVELMSKAVDLHGPYLKGVNDWGMKMLNY